MPDLRFFRSFSKAAIFAAMLAGCQTTGRTEATDAVASAGGAVRTDGAATAVQAVRFNSEEFVGYSPERVLPVLGAPDFVRRDGSAQIWQYRATNCILDLFLYTSAGGTRVKHAELRPRVPGAEPLDSCYSRMRRERAGQPTS